MDKIKDLGVVFDSRLKFDEHIHQKNNKAYQMLGIIKRHFIYLTPDSFVVLYKALVRSHLEYAAGPKISNICHCTNGRIEAPRRVGRNFWISDI